MRKDYNETECLTLLRDTIFFLLRFYSYTNMFGRIAVFFQCTHSSSVTFECAFFSVFRECTKKSNLRLYNRLPNGLDKWQKWKRIKSFGCMCPFQTYCHTTNKTAFIVSSPSLPLQHQQMQISVIGIPCSDYLDLGDVFDMIFYVWVDLIFFLLKNSKLICWSKKQTLTFNIHRKLPFICITQW